MQTKIILNSTARLSQHADSCIHNMKAFCLCRHLVHVVQDPDVAGRPQVASLCAAPGYVIVTPVLFAQAQPSTGLSGYYSAPITFTYSPM